MHKQNLNQKNGDDFVYFIEAKTGSMLILQAYDSSTSLLDGSGSKELA